MAHGLSCPEAFWILLDQGSNLCSPELSGQFLTTGPLGKYRSKTLSAFGVENKNSSRF